MSAVSMQGLRVYRLASHFCFVPSVIYADHSLSFCPFSPFLNSDFCKLAGISSVLMEGLSVRVRSDNRCVV